MRWRWSPWLFLRHRAHGLTRQISLALILGGAMGNLIDRVRFGEVVDFILLSAGARGTVPGVQRGRLAR